jgi:hypothetical protein
MENWPVGIKKKKSKENRKKIKIESTKIAAPMQPGSHQHMAMQKHQGIVKKPLAQKLENIEHWIKKRNLGELPAEGMKKTKKKKNKNRGLATAQAY